MTQREQDWLLKIQFLQLEGSISDPYKEDYYSVAYNSKQLERAARSRKDDTDTRPELVLPERSSRVDRNEPPSDEDNRTKYQPWQFEGTLGKIQVSNLNRPRKLLELSNMNEKSGDSNESVPPTPSRSELAKLKKLLLDIERLYLILLDIDYEDKRMAALPESARGQHLTKRQELCKKLYDGLTTSGGQLNELISSIRKGRSLIFRTLTLLTDARQKAVLITHVLDRNLHLNMKKEDQNLYGLDYSQILIDAIKTVKDSDSELLCHIGSDPTDILNAVLQTVPSLLSSCS
jgi:hypothetical protein